MQPATPISFELFLEQQDAETWLATITALLRSIHEVDKTAIQIWFSFYPLELFHALQEAEDPEQLARELLLQGNYWLKNQIDTSHKFLYGHRYWPEVKKAIAEHAAGFREMNEKPLTDQILDVANRVATTLRVDLSLTTGITAVGFMTVQQVGLRAFNSSAGQIAIDTKHAKQSADSILKDRAKDDGQGFFGFLKTVDKKWTVTHDENDDSAKYKLNNAQDLAWGAEADRTRDWRALDPRRIEGPIPVECRSASCGTCWVGVLGGSEKLSDVAVREGKQIKLFGYINTTEPKPLIRLACQAQAQGAVSIVIPPWNGVFGKYLQRRNRGSQENE
jgi:ferredoxin